MTNSEQRQDDRLDVCAAVVSDLSYDARVWKEARSLSTHGYTVTLMGCRYDILAVRRRREGSLEVVEIPFGPRGRVSSRQRTLAVARLWWAILRRPARAYHAHNIHTGPPCWVASRLRGARLVYDGHELYGHPPSGASPSRRALARLELAVERFLVRRSDAVITTNPSRRSVFERRHGRRSITVLRNVPAKSDHVTPIDPGYLAQGITLLYQGGVYAEARAFRETVQALRSLPNVNLAILGFGRDRDFDLIRSWAEEAGVDGRVSFFPPRPFDELVSTAAAATVGLVPLKPNTINHELGDTNKLHEYLMAGLPVVASDLPELRRVVREGVPPVGEVFDPRSPESLAAAITRVVSDRETYEQRRQEARRLALERFNWTVEERQLLELYEKLLRMGSSAQKVATR